MARSDVTDMEAFQRLSDQYRPDLEGPFIGERLSMSALVTEYAQADPTYITKTESLAHSHIAYRRIKGDGQCGWRAAVFGYFEILFKSGDISLVEQELIRVRSFETVIRSAGGDYDILEDLFELTFALFDQMLQALRDQNHDPSLVLNTFNEENASNSIVYHFKMMTSCYMALHPDDFEPFLDEPLLSYRQSRLDPANQEIDQIGLQALTTGVIAPAGIGLEVLYLDRSAGDDVTVHQFVDTSDDRPAIRLLYRPGHYDIIYRDDRPITVFLQSHIQPDHTSSYVEQNDDLELYGLFPSSSYDSTGNGSFSLGNAAGAQDPSVYQQSYDLNGSSINEQQFYRAAGYFPPPHDLVNSQAQPHFHQNPPAPPPPPPTQYLAYSPQYTESPPSQPPSQPPPQHEEPASEPSTCSSSGQWEIRFSNVMPNRNPFGRQSHWNRQLLMPFDQRSVANFSQSQASIGNKQFQPELWDAKQQYNK